MTSVMDQRSFITIVGEPAISIVPFERGVEEDAIRSIGLCWCLLTVVVLLISLAGCAPLVHMDDPSPQGPRISHLRFVPSVTWAGCPVNAKFRLDSATEDIVSANCAWVRRHGRGAEFGRSTLPLDLAASRAGHEEEVEAPFTPDNSGTYYYYVQVGDRLGRLSNVLRGILPVDHRWTEPAPPCPAGER